MNMSKKIGILTFHRATNYGAVLQAYALVSYLNEQGYEAKIIDYKPNDMAEIISPISKKNLKGVIIWLYSNLKNITTLRGKYAKRKIFWEYVNATLPMTSKVATEEDIPVLDAIIVGSDQVWSTCFTGGVDKFYFGQFDSKGAKLISYAGSAAEDMKGSFYSTSNAKLLNDFDAISVREDELQEYLQKQLCNKEIVRVLDPTLMAGRDIFDKLVKDTVPLDKPYVLIYQVIRKQDEKIQKYARQKAKELGCVVVEIKDSKMYVDYGNGYVENGWVNPTMFVALHKKSEYIITTSFHGTAFSLMFNREFDVVSVSPEVDSRAKALLHQLKLDERMVSLPCQITHKPLIYKEVNEIMDELRKPSREFLKGALV